MLLIGYNFIDETIFKKENNKIIVIVSLNFYYTGSILWRPWTFYMMLLYLPLASKQVEYDFVLYS